MGPMSCWRKRPRATHHWLGSVGCAAGGPPEAEPTLPFGRWPGGILCVFAAELRRVGPAAVDPDAVTHAHGPVRGKRLGRDPGPAEAEHAVVAGQPGRRVVGMVG